MELMKVFTGVSFVLFDNSDEKCESERETIGKCLSKRGESLSHPELLSVRR